MEMACLDHAVSLGQEGDQAEGVEYGRVIRDNEQTGFLKGLYIVTTQSHHMQEFEDAEEVSYGAVYPTLGSDFLFFAGSRSRSDDREDN